MNHANTLNNNTSNIKNALSEADIDQLSDLLDTINETQPCVSLETFDGIAAALAVMIRPVAFQELLPLILDSETTPAAELATVLSAKDTLQLTTLMQRRVNHTERLLSNTSIADLSDPRAYYPWVVDYAQMAQMPDQPKQSDELAELPSELPLLGIEWAMGFIATVEFLADDWRVADELLDDELNPMLAPFYALLLEKADWPAEIREQDVGGNDREGWLAQAIWACYELWEYWRYHAPKPKVVQVITPAANKLGRNDPCHCGSGKKFKVCHALQGLQS